MGGMLAVVLAVLAALHLTHAAYPGVKLSVSQRGLDYATKQTLAELNRQLPGMTLPSESGRSHGVKYSATSLRVNSYNSGTGKVRLSTGKLTLQLSNGHVSLRGNWRYEKKILWWKLRDSGSFYVRVDGAYITANVVLGASNGRPTIRTTSCSSGVRSVNIRFSGGASWFYNLFRGILGRFLRKPVGKAICKGAEKVINNEMKTALAKVLVEHPLGQGVSLNYGLSSPPYVRYGKMEISLKGEVTGKGGYRVPIRAPALPYYPTHKMVTIWMSEYIMNTMGQVLHKDGILKYTTKVGDLMTSNSHTLTSVFNSPVIRGKLPPEILVKGFDKVKFGIDLATSDAPTLDISTSGGLKAHFAGQANFSAHYGGTYPKTLLSMAITTEISLVPALANNKVTAKITTIRPTIKTISSVIGDVETSYLNKLLGVVSQFVHLKLNEVGHRGLDLPQIPYADFISPSLVTRQNALILMADVRFNPRKIPK